MSSNPSTATTTTKKQNKNPIYLPPQRSSLIAHRVGGANKLPWTYFTIPLVRVEPTFQKAPLLIWSIRGSDFNT
jgi:hypothetical protein